jgi:hypothetical protein
MKKINKSWTRQTQDASSEERQQQDSKLVVADPNEIRPARPIPKKGIAEVIKWHHEVITSGRSALEKAFKIGSRLRGWHDLIPHGRWLEWVKENLPISERTVRVYVQLWDNHERIEAYFQIGRASADLVEAKSIDVTNAPSIHKALALLENNSADHSAANPIRRKPPLLTRPKASLRKAVKETMGCSCLCQSCRTLLAATIEGREQP